MHCYCKKRYLKLISFSSIVFFRNSLNLFAVVFIFCCQAIFSKIIIILKLNNLRIFFFIEFLKMTILIFFFSLAAFFAVKYIIYMLVLKFLKTLYFDEHNIIEFFKRFKELCDQYKIFVKKWWVKFSWYCEQLIIKFIKTSISYVNRNWLAFDKEIRKKYKDKNAK